ncbi:MAG TPA: alanine racemase [Mycobacteriales bacterium]
MSTPATAVVDLDAIAASVAACAEAAPTAQVMAVVKADGYGHGLLPSARAALRGGATWLGVAQLGEALALRAGGVTAPVLSWLHVPGGPMREAVDAGVDLGVSAHWALQEIVAAAGESGRPARVHLKVDTALRRNGVTMADLDDLLDALAAAQADGTVHIAGMMTHFVWADEPEHPTTALQLEAFTEALARAKARGIEPDVRHAANSAATLTRPDAHFDVVRPGIACYGISPVPQLDADFGLLPAMTLTARVALTKRADAGDGVSYGHQWHADVPTTLALVPLGYADGIPRNATNVGEVLLAGRRRRVAGRVCMDQFVVPVGDDEVREGDEVVLFGTGADGEPTAQDWADATGTIAYEIVTRIGARVPRTYVGAEVGR